MGRQLIFKREVAELKDRLAVSERDALKIAATARAHHSDKVIKLIKTVLFSDNSTFKLIKVR